MKKILIPKIAIGISFLFILFSCSKVTDTGRPIYGVTGFVLDSASDQPIDSAWIDLYDTVPPYWAYTDSAGKYSLSFYVGSENQKRIFVGKSGFLTFDTLIQFSIPQEDIDTVNIFLEPD